MAKTDDHDTEQLLIDMLHPRLTMQEYGMDQYCRFCSIIKWLDGLGTRFTGISLLMFVTGQILFVDVSLLMLQSKSGSRESTAIKQICRSCWTLGQVLYVLAALQLIACAIAFVLIVRLSWLRVSRVTPQWGTDA